MWRPSYASLVHESLDIHIMSLHYAWAVECLHNVLYGKTPVMNTAGKNFMLTKQSVSNVVAMKDMR